MESPDISQFLSTISRYITAKDNNKPHLLPHVFDHSATLAMAVNTDGISFPSNVSGVSAISDVLVTQFNQHYENIYTFCLSDSIEREGSSLSCKWLVAMTEKDGGQLKIGYGKYGWDFDPNNGTLVDKLTITIEHMVVIAFQCTSHLFNELSEIPYPWCVSNIVRMKVPSSPLFDDVRAFLET
ncbi:hypothetical protein L4D06_16025 [Enterovibrio makurazakiensis]|uniref:SnoaL-like domain-containing protein n=1 Tax=Enterovibrio gelatinilyticus TaxID=2899819 RepID=A0ABT5R2F4_9GAMM|nr:hypothetical protein [Enterovibrio sp. ZSDZ42]MDD1794452.1 hypothetical protein [Enterovibrio sp. ZSDZ42]